MEAYTWYLKNVLGLQSVICPEVTVQEVLLEPKSPNKILIVDSLPWDAAAKELFGKMMAAMKLAESEIQTVFLSEVSGADLQVKALSSSHVICFADKTAADFAVEENFFTKTVSPSILTLKTDLKRQAWEDLKSALHKMEEHKF